MIVDNNLCVNGIKHDLIDYYTIKYAELREARRRLHSGSKLVVSLFVYEAFRHSTLSFLKPKTLVEGPFDGLRTVYCPPSLFTMLYHRRSHHSLV